MNYNSDIIQLLYLLNKIITNHDRDDRRKMEAASGKGGGIKTQNEGYEQTLLCPSSKHTFHHKITAACDRQSKTQ